MLFTTIDFAVFLAALLAILTVAGHDRSRKVILLAASYLFYGWSHPIYLLPLLLTSSVDYTVGRLLGTEEDPNRRRRLLTVSIIANLSLLGWFKYANFFVANATSLAHAAGFDAAIPLVQVILPVGISFYTFHAMSYTIDVYRREIPPCRSALEFALFITFFPVLVAGPILRARLFLPQLCQRVTLRFAPGTLLLIVRGLAKKALVADNLAPFVESVFGHVERWPSLVVWTATIAFSVQIYCDFSGYSDIARGLARIFGFEIPVNFHRPYFATNPSEFWRRWHISLSTWLRDYLYIPLGGNRGGPARTFRNLMITMLLGGLWHGASWNFVIWGGFHGLLLAGHQIVRHRTGAPSRIKTVVAWLAMQYALLLSWIPFRAANPNTMWVALRKFVLFDFDVAVFNMGLNSIFFVSTVALLMAFFTIHLWSHFHGDLDERIGRLPWPLAMGMATVAGFLFVILWPAAQVPFIYFQF